MPDFKWNTCFYPLAKKREAIKMSQYSPMNKAFEYPEISRRINHQEYAEVVSRAKELGLTNLDIQGD